MTRPRVLVVEPDALLRALVSEWLEQEDMEAIFPPTGPFEASARLGRIGAVVIDIPSPAHAERVLRAWRRQFPQVDFIAASARFPAGIHADDAMARRLAVTKLLAKPFSRRQLFAALAACRGVIDEPDARNV